MAEDLTELTSKVTRQGATLCFPLETVAEGTLERFGFEPETPVILRLTDERLEVWPLTRVIREKLRQAAGDLRDFTERIRGFARALPTVPDEQTTAEAAREGELLGMLECLLADDLDPAVRKLESVDELSGPERPPSPAADRETGCR
jgi:hypothetical protein